MRKKLFKITQAAILAIAMAFTFSCSSDDDKGDGGGEFAYGTLSYAGKNYKTIKIGNQTWMAENLNYSGTTSDEIGSCYSDDPANCTTYGRLYRWQAANTICPDGWHLPSKDEWTELRTYIENDKNCTSCDAKHLKAKSGWKEYDGSSGGLDSYGFAAMPGGTSCSGEGYLKAGENGYWWSASEWSSNSDFHITTIMKEKLDSSTNDNSGKSCSASVRCVKDQ